MSGVSWSTKIAVVATVPGKLQSRLNQIFEGLETLTRTEKAMMVLLNNNHLYQYHCAYLSAVSDLSACELEFPVQLANLICLAEVSRRYIKNCCGVLKICLFSVATQTLCRYVWHQYQTRPEHNYSASCTPI